MATARPSRLRQQAGTSTLAFEQGAKDWRPAKDSREGYLCQGSITADRLPDVFAIQAVSELVDAFVAIDRLTIDKSVEWPDAAVAIGYGSSVEPTAFR